MKNAINTDIVKIHPDYVIWDLNKKSKFKDNSFDLIIGNYALNYIKPENFIKVMKELHRIAKPNATLILRAKTTNSRTSMVSMPFRLHPNDINNFCTENGWYAKRHKFKYEIIEENCNNLFKRWATILAYELRVIK